MKEEVPEKPEKEYQHEESSSEEEEEEENRQEIKPNSKKSPPKGNKEAEKMLFGPDSCSDTSSVEESMIFGAAQSVPVQDLGLYVSPKVRDDWKVRATVVKKGKIIRYRDDGQLFKIEIVDENQKCIEGIFYRDCCQKFFDTIEEGLTFTFGKAEIAPANKKFTSIDHDFRIIFKEFSLIRLCGKGKKKLDKVHFNFRPLIDLKEITEIKQIDVIGTALVDAEYEPREYHMKHGKESLEGKTSFVIQDKNMTSINVYMWGELAQKNQKITKNDLVILQGARVSQFSTKSLSCSIDHCKAYVNPNQNWADKYYSDFPNVKKPKI